MFDIGQIITDVAPSVIDLAGTLLTNESNSESASNYNSGLKDVADILRTGYDEQLGTVTEGAKALEDLLIKGWYDTSNQVEDAGQQYGKDVRGAYTGYGDQLFPAQQNYAEGLTSSDVQYMLDMGMTEDQIGQLLMTGSEGFRNTLSPYMQTGGEALSYMNSVMQGDPSQLNPYQAKVMDDYKRDIIANLASTGLRSAGRAGVAAYNKGVGDLAADFYQQNQNRSDDMARSLNSQGYGAATNTAQNIQGLYDSLGDLRFKIGTDTAANKLKTGQEIAKSGFDVSKDVASKYLQGEGNVASNTYNTNMALAEMLGKLYQGKGDLTGSVYNTKANTGLQKAVASASAADKGALANYSSDMQNNSNISDAFGKIAGAVQKTASDAFKEKNNGSTLISSGTGNNYSASGDLGMSNKSWING